VIPTDLFDAIRRAACETDRIYGVVVGVVTNNQDPIGQGRVKVTFPWLSEEHESHWARVVAPMAGKDRGLYYLDSVSHAYSPKRGYRTAFTVRRSAT